MTTSSQLREKLATLYQRERFGIKLGLEVMTRLLAELGNPHQQFKSVHLTGTNGKGSTAAMLESILRHAGYKTGLYTSPHLYRFNERMRLNGVEIADHELEECLDQVAAAVATSGVEPTFFEWVTTVAFLFFARQHLDIAIIEVGMGGQLDATNVLLPEVAVITNIGLDHTRLLGPTTRDIALRKAGIIKPHRPVVTAEAAPDILALLLEQSRAKQAPFYQVRQQYTASRTNDTLRTQVVTVTAHHKEGSLPAQFPVEVPLLGDHQITNMLTALTVVTQLQSRGFPVRLADIQQGVAKTRWEGRLEVVSTQPLVVVDGAHNESGVTALRAFVEQLSRHDVVVLGLKQGNDSQALKRLIVPLFKKVIVTEGVYQPMTTADLRQEFADIHTDIEEIPNPRHAAARGQELAGKAGTLLVTGSLYMIPEVLAYLKHKGEIDTLLP